MSNRRKFIQQLGIGAAGLGLSSFIINNDEIVELLGNKTLIKPNKLKEGDMIALFAPGGAVFNKTYIEKASNVLKSLGFNVKLCNSLNTQYGQFSDTAENRAKELNELFKDKSVNGMIAMRGGSGCAKILPLLDYELIKTNPKALIGYSDITSLINGIHAKTGLTGFHGPVGYSTWNEFTIKHFRSALMKYYTFTCNDSFDNEVKILNEGVTVGNLYGGNLTVLNSLIGTEYLPDLTNSILFIEEVAEEPYYIDRLLTQWKQIGVLDKLSGIVIGKCAKCIPEEPEKSLTLEQTLINNLKPLNIPCYIYSNFGHVNNKFTLPVGIRVKLDATNKKIELLESGVI